MSSTTASLPVGERVAAALRSAAGKHVLFFGVGGGNDANSTMMVQLQLARDYGFAPGRISVLAMLPDLLLYRGFEPGPHPDVLRFTPHATRHHQNHKKMSTFPDPLLEEHKALFGVEQVYGLVMSSGSEGAYAALKEMLVKLEVDLMIACDVGGDFIAARANGDVLSPMMDAYALRALKELHRLGPAVPMVFCVFGLGTDGESSPQMLAQALTTLGEHVRGRFDPEVVAPVERFYREVVEQNRKSWTADLTFRTIHNSPELAAPINFNRTRFATYPTRDGKPNVYHAGFSHQLDPTLHGVYVLFDSAGLLAIDNPFEVACVSGLDWFFGIQGNGHARANHELQGFEYASLEAQVGLPSTSTQHSVFFGTPSRRFLDTDCRAIAQDVVASVSCGRFDSALMFTEDVPGTLPGTVLRHQITEGLTLLVNKGKKDIPVEAVRALARKYTPRRVPAAAAAIAAAAAVAALALIVRRYSRGAR